jgi:hypothetical protein
MTFVLAGVVVLGICIFWISQFVLLMLLSDSDFPGKYDKCLWLVAFILAFVVAPFAFFVWTYAYKAIVVKRAEGRQ